MKSIIKKIHKRGLKATFQIIAQKAIGVDFRKIESEIQTLQFFLNALHSPSEILVTNDPELKIMQECDVIVLQIIDSLCKKHQLTYWLAYGTFLGCIRHGGFIPWDDDTDISMPRTDYNKAITIFKEELIPVGFDVYEDRRLCIGYKHSKTGIWVDIFPVDDYYDVSPLEERRDALKKKLAIYKKNDDESKDHSIEWRENLRNKKIGGEKTDHTSYHFLISCPEFNPYGGIIHNYKDIYPLCQRKFGTVNFWTPNDEFEYLSKCYGYHYMAFPKTGILHHDLGRGPLSSWASKNGINMIEIKNELLRIYDGLTK